VVIESTDIENMLHHNVDTLQDGIDRLFNERSELQRFVSRFKSSNRRYLQIRRMAEEVVDRLLAERKSLLTSAIIAVIEALRMNPDRYAIIYNSKYDNDNSTFDSSMGTTVTAIASSPSTSISTTKPHRNHYYNEYHEGILEIANSLLKILTNQMVNNTMVAAVKEQ
jgi:chorismate mutase